MLQAIYSRPAAARALLGFSQSGTRMGNKNSASSPRLSFFGKKHQSHHQVVSCVSHATQTSSWLPPAENWDPGDTGLPYGWEVAADKDGKQYFINHLNKTTTYEDPRKDFPEEPPQPREVDLTRHPELGFGFVAGSEKPVIVRFVTEGGPSVDKLLPGDQILQINGEDVKKAPRDHVIQLVRSCKDSVRLTVCQPPLDNSARKSALLSAAKKAKLKSNPSRVRFAEGVVINGSPLFTPSNFSTGESCVPFLPNVLKVFLENGQTKSFKYDSSTTVRDVLESLQQKLGLRCLDHFSLVVEHIKSLRRNKLTLLDPKETLARIAARPGAHNLRCLFRVTFVPKDAYELLRKDAVALEYLYTQCCNDVVQERFAPELKYDIALRLAALHIQQHALSNNMQSKITIKAIEREFGLERFVPVSLVETMKRKELRKLLAHFLKLNQGLAAPGHKTLTALQAKLHYLRIISELPSYGAKCFATNLRDSNMETVILISPKFGISQIAGLRNSVRRIRSRTSQRSPFLLLNEGKKTLPSPAAGNLLKPLNLCDIEHLSSVHVTREDELSHKVELKLKDPDKESLLLSLEDRDAEELVLVLQGYFKLLADRPLPVHRERDRWAEDSALPYHTKHRVSPSSWSYLDPPPAPLAQSSLCGEVPIPLEPRVDTALIDLSAIPPYLPQPPHVVPNGHIPNASQGFGKGHLPKAMAATLATGDAFRVDNNMNKTLPLLRVGDNGNNNNLSPGDDNRQRRPPLETTTTTTGGNNTAQNNTTPNNSTTQPSSLDVQSSSQKLGFDIQSVVSMEILEGDVCSGNDEFSQQVMRRVAEMKQLVEDAESYLTDRENEEDEPAEVDVEAHDTESLRSGLSHTDSELSASYGQLKHSDSLLLLTQGQKQLGDPMQVAEVATVAIAVKKIELPPGDNESDTDSLSTPTDSPSHRPTQSSQPNAPNGTSPNGANTSATPAKRPASMLKSSDSSFGLHSPDNFLAGLQSHDVQELLRRLQEENILPYSFAEGTLYLDPDIIDLTMIPPPITPDDERARLLPCQLSTPPTPFADRLSLEYELQLQALSRRAARDPEAWKLDLCCDDHDLETVIGAPDLDDSLSLSNYSASLASEDSIFLPPPPGETDYPQQWADDIDSFIATVTVPPPPSGDTAQFSPAVADEELAAYIIPPPPGSAPLEQDRLGEEVRVSAERREKDVSAKIAAIQRQLAPVAKPRSVMAVHGSLPRGGHADMLPRKCEDESVSVAERKARLESAMGRPPVSVPKSSSQNDLSHSPSKALLSSTDDHSTFNTSTPKALLSLSIDDVAHPNTFNTSPSKRSLAGTSSSDSLASNTSVATVKSAWSTNSEDECCSPPLPPRGSPAKPPLPPVPNGSGLVAPPRVPSRLRKPSTNGTPGSPTKGSPTRKLPAAPVCGAGSGKAPMPDPQALSTRKPLIVTTSKLPRPQLVSPSASGRANGVGMVNGGNSTLPKSAVVKAKGGLSPPLKTSSPKMALRNGHNMVNGDSGSEAKMLNGSHNKDAEFDRDSLDGSSSHKGSKNIFSGASVSLERVVLKLEDIASQCSAAESAGGGVYMNEDKFQLSKELLTCESRQFVTASKLFVKGATESEAQVGRCLSNCVLMLEQLADITEDVANYTCTPAHTHNLALKVKDVAETFLQTVHAAEHARRDGLQDSAMNLLMQRATVLASTLTALMRALRVFAP